MPKIELTDAEARGRNGWFAAQQVTISRLNASGRIALNVTSKHFTYPGPIYLEMPPAEAHKLGEALIEVAQEAGEEVAGQ
jgi:hypothetical protein